MKTILLAPGDGILSSKSLNMRKVRLFNFLFLALVSFHSKAQINYDEEEIPRYKLPGLLTTIDDQKIRSSQDWIGMRRGEILTLFSNNVYGSVPMDQVEVHFLLRSSDSKALNESALRKEVDMIISNGKDSLVVGILIYLPQDTDKEVPLFIGLNFYGNHTIINDPRIRLTSSWVQNNEEFGIYNNMVSDDSRGVRSHRWPVEMILNRGFGIATIYYGDIDPDFDDEFKNGLHSLLNYEDLAARSSISAWAFSLSSALDYFEQDPQIDENRIVVLGHSRLGKSALWAGAIDQRFAMVISNNSGCGGAALSRRRYGETVKRINTSFPHWFSQNFHNYNDREDDLPVDQHMLIALLAPRPVYIASAADDKWADPKGEYLSLYHTGPVYKLFGNEVFAEMDLPPIDEPRRTGKMGYHIRSGKHDLTAYDWEQFLEFADLHLK
jgi:hypothetical protein